MAGGVPANHIARWDGAAWSALGAGMDQRVDALIALPNGDLVAGGVFTTAGSVNANHIARWNGSAWSTLGTGMNSLVRALTTLPNGDLVAGGRFTTAGGVSAENIARWDGSAWAPLGAGLNDDVVALTTLPNGDLVAGGDFIRSGVFGVPYLARWDGSAWLPLGWGVDRWVHALTTLPDCDVVAGGSFAKAVNITLIVSAFVGRFRPTCPGTAVSYGSGCVGSAGAVALAGNNSPWLGATFHATATGMGSSSVAFALLGCAQTSIPLSSLHPAALPGCELLIDLRCVASWPLIAVAGAVRPSLFIPNDPVLGGGVVHMQVLQAELGASMAITGITSSNGLVLTLGTY